MNSMAFLPILYSFRRCPYAMRARMALAASAIPYVIREVSLKEKPVAMLQLSPKGTVPVLVLPDSRVIDESLDIMHWALEQNDPEHWLTADAHTTKVMNDLVVSNDGPFKFHLDRMKYATRYPGSELVDHRAEAIKLLAPLEARLRANTFLFNSSPMFADVAAFPFVRQFARTDAMAFAALPLRGLQSWLARWESSALFQATMEKYPLWSGDEDIYA